MGAAREAASAALEGIRAAADLASASNNPAATRCYRAAETATLDCLRCLTEVSVKAGEASGSTNEDMGARADIDEGDTLSSSSTGAKIPERVRRLDSNPEEDCAETRQFDIMRSWQLAFHSTAFAFAQDADAGVSLGDDSVWTMPSVETTFRTGEPG